MRQGVISLIARCVMLLGLVLVGILVVSQPDRFMTTIAEWMEAVRGLGPWTYVVLIACYIPAALLGIPVTFITPGVGFVLGPFEGFLVAMIGVTLGTALNYWISRTLLRKSFVDWAAKNYRLRALEIACRTRGFQVVALTRLTPVFPMYPMSYFFGLTSVPFGPYLLATIIGMLPRTSLQVAAGATAKSLADTSGGAAFDQPAWLIGTVLVVTAVVCGLIARIADRALRDAMYNAEEAQPDAAGPSGL